ncbi:hypothetical protein [Gluconobacter albidus]|uniref:hypothetical protein n=1 Tax=Gluconobacter albidus TaxID=318683 RepID=UPI001B8CD55E|nr:hypothetical protein [Gluconobacter albidus]MBS1028396.1 hypothetical protein [Gluconobacter albidus]
MRSVNRRDIFPALGAVLLGGIATASLAKPESLSTAPAKPECHKSDTHLIALCEQFIALQREIDLIHEPIDSFEDEERAEPALKEIFKRENEMFAQIIHAPAVTFEGIRAKAKAMISWDREGVEDNSDNIWRDRLLNSMLRDCLAV